MFTGSHGKNTYPFKGSPMCGIIGYSGSENAVPILLSGLKRLEYRGYDSSGISVFQKSGILTVKSKGRIKENESKLLSLHKELYSNCGIGHTRWATHGEPSDINSHPHTTDMISLVHNGIIENYISLKNKLSESGYDFSSETDTEAAAKLIDQKYRQMKDPIKAITASLKEIQGSYAFGIMFTDLPGKIFAVRKDSPLIIAKSDSGSFIASDIPAILKYTNNICRPENGEMAILSGTDVTFLDSNGNTITKEFQTEDMSFDSAEKDGFPHFMLKEIHEEPSAIQRSILSKANGIISDAAMNFLCKERLDKCGTIHIVACGTAMHAGLMGKYFIEKYARIPVNAEIASEFRYRSPILNSNDIFIAVTQSGETADTLAALRLAKEAGLYTVSVVNVVGSAAARESDSVIYTHAGIEIAVASTKAYSVQVCTLYLLALNIALKKGLISESSVCEKILTLTEEAPEKIREILAETDIIHNLCNCLSGCNNMFFIGRGIDYALSLEASLKMKEISYIHSEAYAAGELKHGTISLVTEGTHVFALITEKNLYAKTLSNIKEVKARGAVVTVICDRELDIPGDVCENIIKVPHISHELTCLSCATAFQLAAYHTAVIRGCDPDMPRNLAKSVTVE